MQEQDRYGDLLQNGVIDSYRNLTYKTVSTLKFAADYCTSSRYVIKIDDDVFPLLPKLAQTLLSIKVGRVIAGFVQDRMPVKRNKSAQWYVSKQEYPHDGFYPTYTYGGLYAISSDLVPSLYQRARMSLTQKYFYIEDIFVTGLTAKKLGNINYKNITIEYYYNATTVTSACEFKRTENLAYNPVNISEVSRLWKSLKGVGRGYTNCQK